MKTIAIINQKGGVGKTTTAQNLAAALNLLDKKALLIDLDPQCNLSYMLDAENSTRLTALDVMQEPGRIIEAIYSKGEQDIIVSSDFLASAELKTSTKLKESIDFAYQDLQQTYDFILIDTPPALGLLTLNALTAADHVLVAAQADIFSMQGVTQLKSTIDAVNNAFNRNLSFIGILITRFNPRSNLRKELAQGLGELAEKINTKVFNTKIRECTAIAESQALQRDIIDYAKRSNGAQDYIEFATEFLQAL